MNGVQANAGNWNPTKWDWEKSWSSVLGGAIGGAAISGALGNITQSAGAIKNFLPGIVSGGLNSAFSGGNFLNGAIAGITYSGSLFYNKVTSTDPINAGYRYRVSSDSEEVFKSSNSAYLAKDPLSISLVIAGLNPNAPANMYSLGIITSMFAPKDAWIAIANSTTMTEWAEKYVPFAIRSDGHIFDERKLGAKPILGITNPTTGKILLAPILFNGKKTNYGLSEIIIHEGKHFTNFINGMFQGNHPIISALDEVSAYTTAGWWTGHVDSGVKDYLFDISQYLFNIQNIIK